MLYFAHVNWQRYDVNSAYNFALIFISLVLACFNRAVLIIVAGFLHTD